MSIASRLQELKVVKNNIKTAIQNKGVNMTNVPFTEYATKINTIRTGSGNATAGDVLSGKTFTNSTGEPLTGTMANNGAVNANVTSGSQYTIPAGYHNGQGKVSATGGNYAGYILKYGSIALSELIKIKGIPLALKTGAAGWGDTECFRAGQTNFGTNLVIYETPGTGYTAHTLRTSVYIDLEATYGLEKCKQITSADGTIVKWLEPIV